jgi:hypothetical protein
MGFSFLVHACFLVLFLTSQDGCVDPKQQEQQEKAIYTRPSFAHKQCRICRRTQESLQPRSFNLSHLSTIVVYPLSMPLQRKLLLELDKNIDLQNAKLGHLMVKDAKMSKSLRNFLTVEELWFDHDQILAAV